MLSSFTGVVGRRRTSTSSCCYGYKIARLQPPIPLSSNGLTILEPHLSILCHIPCHKVSVRSPGSESWVYAGQCNALVVMWQAYCSAMISRHELWSQPWRSLTIYDPAATSFCVYTSVHRPPLPPFERLLVEFCVSDSKDDFPTRF